MVLTVKRAYCPRCGRVLRINARGRMYRHKHRGTDLPCAGSGQTPAAYYEVQMDVYEAIREEARQDFEGVYEME